MAGHHREVIQKGTRCNRLVERLLGVMHPQPSPALGGIAVQAQHPIAVVLPQLQQPWLQSFRLGQIAASNNGQSCSPASAKKARTPALARSPLLASLITLVSIKNMTCGVNSRHRAWRPRVRPTGGAVE